MRRDLYLYALVRADGDPLLGDGLGGEPLRRIAAGPVAAVVGDVEAPPVTPDTLAAHDAVVRRLFDSLPAVLPARFGQAVPDEKALTDWITARERELVEALALVEGCVQMTLRVFARPDQVPEGEPGPEPAEIPDDLGPGARYLHTRKEAVERSRTLPEIAPLREALRPLLRAERVQRVDYSGEPPRPLRASVYDLIPRGEVEAYIRLLEETAPRLAGWKITASGPWPPYAFAPGLLA